MRVVFASGNAGKIREIQEIMSDVGVKIIPQGEMGIDSVEETGSTFVDNALLKARHAASAAGLPAMADDSGLSVDALAGGPGVYSARFAGEYAGDDQNIDKLLHIMREVPDEERSAAFRCAAVFVEADDAEEPLIVEAEWRGTVLREKQGSSGFGYDPVFFDAEAGISAAEMSAEEKNSRSHRGKAFRELAELLERRLLGK